MINWIRLFMHYKFNPKRIRAHLRTVKIVMGVTKRNKERERDLIGKNMDMSFLYPIDTNSDDNHTKNEGK